MPKVHVEFFGVPRLKAGISQIDVDATDVASVLKSLEADVPRFSDACLIDGQLRQEYLLSVNGKLFTRDRTIELQDGDEIYILSADVGG